MTQPTITGLAAALDDAGRVEVVLGAAWDAFDVVGRLADALALDEGGDERQAMLVGIKCADGRRMLPPPEHGRPLETGSRAPAEPDSSRTRRCCVTSTWQRADWPPHRNARTTPSSSSSWPATRQPQRISS
ncbi:hypothetical protein ABS735_02550 [Streptomyces sp. MMCC 100]|uniref:hypothetical protein n=1 Tax=Streptomyces sp. MMCC 100 TaxID=3163555 RepID=UPI00359921A0